MELEEVIKRLTLKAITSSAEAPDYPNCIVMKKDLQVILNHLTKQDKMIELMSRFIDTELSSEHLSKVLKIEVKPLETYREDIKQYFEKKAEEEN